MEKGERPKSQRVASCKRLESAQRHTKSIYRNLILSVRQTKKKTRKFTVMENRCVFLSGSVQFWMVYNFFFAWYLFNTQNRLTALHNARFFFTHGRKRNNIIQKREKKQGAHTNQHTSEPILSYSFILLHFFLLLVIIQFRYYLTTCLAIELKKKEKKKTRNPPENGFSCIEMQMFLNEAACHQQQPKRKKKIELRKICHSTKYLLEFLLLRQQHTPKKKK